jgi:hypothetical protein
MSRSGLAGAVVAPNIYLDEEIGRPDLYTKRMTLDSDITKGHHTTKIFRNILVIVMSAFIFISIVGWANVLKIGYDTLWVNEVILPEFYSTLYYAATVTGISLIGCSIIYWLLVREELPHAKD